MILTANALLFVLTRLKSFPPIVFVLQNKRQRKWKETIFNSSLLPPHSSLILKGGRR